MNAEMEHACVSIARDASFIACAPPPLIAANLKHIDEAIQHLQDARAKAARKMAA